MDTSNAPRIRPPSSYLNFRGDHRHLLDPDQPPMGPNAYGELCWPVTAEYDAETDRTRVGISNIAPVPTA